ncbi:leucine-rich repeat domain-containing protein [Odoribacter lunatus]|uniref:leucine-rich repeat domain-containing protein n=1 Tax=Odoribacter lunatus TaxID=2941335 RepID=UPI0020401751|nr:leucine-rich repeat domain-containing protein [Odoribacter lunatus]
MRHIYFLIFLPLLLLAGIGCSKDKSIEEPDEPDVPVTPVAVTLELSDADLVFDAEGGQKTFTITSNAEWTITNESEWCTTDVTSGTGNRTVTVTSQTYGELEDRNMNLTVKAGDKSQVLEVTQKGKDAIILDKAKFEVAQGGGDLAIKVRSNVTYEVVIPEFCNSWIQPAPETRSEISDTTYRFIIAGNEDEDSRTGYIIFSAASLQDTVRIYQTQKDQLVLTQTKYNLSANDTTIVVELKTNVDYEVSIVGDDISWISRIETRASRVDRLLFHIDENTTDVLRSAKIAVQDKNGILSDTVYIQQSNTNNFDNPNITKYFDPEFAKVLKNKGYIPDASYITLADVKNINTLSINGSYDSWYAGGKGLTSLAGIEYFESLTNLDCSCNQLASLNVSGCTALTRLVCDNNQLTSLNLNRCTALTTVWCTDNQLTSLDVSKNTALTNLGCSLNQLTSLDVSECTALTGLSCSVNQLTSLDVSKNTALTYLNCNDNQLTSLDVSKNTALTSLSCYNNQLTSLDVNGYTALTYLDCASNQLTFLDINGCTALAYLYFGTNQLTSLNLSGYTTLTSLNCYNNQLTSLNLNGCTALTGLNCSFNQLTNLNLNECTTLTSLTCSFNQLTDLDVSKNTALTHLSCFNNQLTSLDASRCTALTYLDCASNQLTFLDISGCTALTTVWCHNNPGDEISLFPVTAWFDNNNIPKAIKNNKKSWDYNGKTITIDFRKAE